MITAPAAAALLALSAGIAAPAPAAGQPLPARYHYQTVTLPGYPSVYLNGISDSGGYAGGTARQLPYAHGFIARPDAGA